MVVLQAQGIRCGRVEPTGVIARILIYGAVGQYAPSGRKGANEFHAVPYGAQHDNVRRPRGLARCHLGGDGRDRQMRELARSQPGA